MRHLSFLGLLLAIGCSSQKPSPAPEPSAPGRVIVATFSGSIDPVAGTFTIRTEPTQVGLALGMKASHVDASVTVANFSDATSGPWNNDVPLWGGQKCPGIPSSGGYVTVTSKLTGTRLDNVWAVIDTMSSTGNGACNGDTALVGNPPLGFTSAQLTNGVWFYGDLTAGAASAAKPWAFTFNSATQPSFFTGHVEAAKVDTFPVGRLPNLFVGGPPGGSFMAGTATQAVFIEGAPGNKLTFVANDGSVVESNAISQTPNAVTVTVTESGSRAWVAADGIIAAVTLSSGVVVEMGVAGPPWNMTSPSQIAVDPVVGSIWFTERNNSRVGWYQPGTASGGTVILTRVPGDGLPPDPGPMVAVEVNDTCKVFIADVSNGGIYQVDCATKTGGTLLALPSGCGYPVDYFAGLFYDLIQGSDGDVWFFGPTVGGTAKACKIEDTTVTAEFGITIPDGASVPGVWRGSTYGPDGNLWAVLIDRDSNSILEVMRLWLTAGTNYGAKTLFNGIPDNQSDGMVTGAGAIWIPYDDGSLVRVSP